MLWISYVPPTRHVPSSEVPNDREAGGTLNLFHSLSLLLCYRYAAVLQYAAAKGFHLPTRLGKPAKSYVRK